MCQFNSQSNICLPQLSNCLSLNCTSSSASSPHGKSTMGHTAEEATLLACVKENSRLPIADQRHYERLRRKHVRTELSEDEFAEYRSLLQQLEARNAKRLEALLALAQKRGMTLRGLMKALALPSSKDAT
jgi:hypothetical protein